MTVEEDGATIELSTHEAIVRAMARAALQGNPSAQHRWIRMVQAAEAEQKRAQIALYNALERDGRARQWSEEESRMVVTTSYDDDIVADSRTGIVVVRDGDG